MKDETDSLQKAAREAIRTRFSDAEAMKPGMPPDVLATSAEVVRIAIELSRLGIDQQRFFENEMKVFSPPEKNIGRAYQLLLSAMKEGCVNIETEKAKIAIHEAECVQFDDLFRKRGKAMDFQLQLADGSICQFRGFADVDLHKGKAFLKLVAETAVRLSRELLERSAEIDKGRRLSNEKASLSLVSRATYKMREMLTILLSRRGKQRDIVIDAMQQLWYWSAPVRSPDDRHEPLLQADDIRELSKALPAGFVESESPSGVDLFLQATPEPTEWAVEATRVLESRLPEVYEAAIQRHFSEGRQIRKSVLALLAHTRKQLKALTGNRSGPNSDENAESEDRKAALGDGND